MRKKPKIIVIGLDGGTWNIIKPLVKQGKLPTLEKLVKDGTYGELESSIPPVTFPAWKCYSTGKNPSKLNLYGFLNVNTKNYKFFPNDSTSYNGKEIWDYLNDKNIICGVVNMPTTYPPKKINKFMISHSIINKSGYTYPKSLESILKNNFDYQLNPKCFFREDKDKTIIECKKIIKQRFYVAKELIKKFKPSFIHLTIFYIDHIQHYYWKYMENNDKKYANVIEDIWKLIDNEINLLLKEFIDKETYTILMSDHGFTSSKGMFYPNQWLLRKNYVSVNRNFFILKQLNKIGINIDRIIYILKKLKLLSILRKIIPEKYQLKLYSILPEKGGGIGKGFGGVTMLIDLEKSKIIPSERIYFNKNIIPKEKYEKLRDELINKMMKIKNPKTGERLHKHIYKKEEIYSGKYLENAPDIIPLYNNGYSDLWGFNTKNKLWDFSDSGITGVHKLHGIFCISGPGIKKNQEIKNAKIIDLAPTILNLFDVSIPNDIDGRVLTECFEEDSELAKREIVFRDVEKIEKLKSKIERLKKLGKV